MHDFALERKCEGSIAPGISAERRDSRRAREEDQIGSTLPASPIRSNAFMRLGAPPIQVAASRIAASVIIIASCLSLPPMRRMSFTC